MTEPVILLGTQSNGETLPVQVNALGQLVAEGLQGPPGPEGPPGADLGLPPDPYEGALLGWLNGELAWVGSPPIPIPEGVFGPITRWEKQSNLLEVEGGIPDYVGNGVYIYQCDENGRYYDGPNRNSDQQWADAMRNFRAANCDPSLSPEALCSFNGNVETGCYQPTTGPIWAANSFISLLDTTVDLKVYCLYRQTGNCVVFYDGGKQLTSSVPSGTPEQAFCEFSNVKNVESITTEGAGGANAYINAIEINGERLIDQRYSLNMRVNQTVGNSIIGNANKDADFSIGKYLRIPAQQVSPWVLYGNDPTSLIDHLRQT